MLDAIEKLLLGNADYSDSGTPQSEEEIDAAANALGVIFPESFRQYLARWGWISFGPLEYQGLGGTVQNVVATTKRIRVQRSIPSHLVIVCDHEGDEYVCLDTDRMINNECPVVVWDSPAQEVSRPCAENFADFLESDIKGFLS